MSATMTTFPRVLARLLADDPGRPLVTFYDEESVRRLAQRLAATGEIPPEVASVLSKPPRLAELRQALGPGGRQDGSGDRLVHASGQVHD